jgi:GR25 family glycosyltransferase involved in LPS biosynthesis
MDNVEHTYINLERDTQRRLDFERGNSRAFASLGMRRTSAVDGRDLPHTWDCSLRRGERGCSLSHLGIWAEACKGGDGSFTAVFEDDIVLHPEYYTQLPGLLEEGREACIARGQRGVGLLYLSRTMGEYQATEKRASGRLWHASEPSMGTHAYVVSKEGACALYDELVKVDLCRSEPVDVFLGDYIREQRLGGSFCALAFDDRHGKLVTLKDSPYSTTQEE